MGGELAAALIALALGVLLALWRGRVIRELERIRKILERWRDE